MGSGSQSLALDEVIFKRLTGAAPVTALVGARVFAEVPQPGAGFPQIVWKIEAARDTSAIGGGDVSLSSFDVLIKGVDKSGGYGTLGAVLDAVHEVVKQLPPDTTAQGCTVRGSVRRRPTRYAEQVGEVQYRHYGAVYRFWVQQAEVIAPVAPVLPGVNRRFFGTFLGRYAGNYSGKAGI